MKTKVLRNLTAIICITATLAGCKKGSENPVGVTGTWELRGQSGTIAGYIKTFPAGNGHILQLNTDNTYKYANHDTVSGQGTYQVIKNSISFGGATYDGIYYNKSASGDFIIQKADTLTIGNTFPDGITTGYVRIK